MSIIDFFKKKKKKVLVIGDSCIDIFWYGRCDKLSPEAPTPIFIPEYKLNNMGMCYNVYNNLVALNVDVDIITNTKYPIKTRYVDEKSTYTLLRVDENDYVDNVEKSILDSIDYEKYDAVVISDYNKGFLTKDNIRLISNNHPLTFLDTKKEMGSWCDNIKFIKVNEREYNKNIYYLENIHQHDSIITLGKKGAMLLSKKMGVLQKKYFLNDNVVNVIDISGAGDTFLASLVYSYLIDKNISKSIYFANKCSSWVVTQKGVSVIDLKQVKL